MPSGRILIVDDDRDIRQTLSEVLEDEGYQVDSVANGREALRVLREPELPAPPAPAAVPAAQRSSGLPCVILLDLMMPVMDGFAFCREQQRDPRLAGIPVVVVTAGGDHQGRALNAAEVITKPIKLTRLLAAIERHRR